MNHQMTGEYLNEKQISQRIRDYPSKGDVAVLYVNEKQASRITGIAVPTLRNDRSRGRGLPYIKLDRSVRYALYDLIEHMENRKITPKGQL